MVAVQQDVDALCDLVTEQYVYLEPRKSVWEETCRRSRVRAMRKRSQTSAGHLALLEQMLDQLWDNHVSLNTNSAVSPRLVPSGSDYWIEFENGKAMVKAVRRGSGAAEAGLQIGDEIISMNSVPVLAAATGRMRYGRTSVSADRLNGIDPD
jgi:carboxyl-terminal processing protease